MTLNLLLFTRLRVVESWMATSFISKYLLDCSNIIDANLRLHTWNGIAMVIMMLMHVWSICLPCVIHGFSAQVIPGSFEWPLSERKPFGFKDANSTAQIMSFQIDDAFRIVEMTIFLGILAPLSYFWFWRKWHIAIHIHRLMALVFCIDIVRRHTHPHSIILNTPLFILWIIDRITFHFLGHFSLEKFHRIKLDEDYMILFWKDDGSLTKTLGPNYYLKLRDSSITENPHAFTTFINRRQSYLGTVGGDWTVGCVVRVLRNKRSMPLSRKDSTSHTGRMADAPDDESNILEAYGPYAGEMSDLIIHSVNGTQPKCCCSCFGSHNGFCKKCMRTISRAFHSDGPVVLIGTGSGINFLLDAMQYKFTGGKQLIILWSTRNTALFDWARKTVNRLVQTTDTHLRIILGNTDKESMIKEAWFSNMLASDRVKTSGGFSPIECYSSENKHPRIISNIIGRINFIREIPMRSQVFFQGSRQVRVAVDAACKTNECDVYFGRGSNYIRKIFLQELVRKTFVAVNRRVSLISEQLTRRPSNASQTSYNPDMHQLRRTTRAGSMSQNRTGIELGQCILQKDPLGSLSSICSDSESLADYE